MGMLGSEHCKNLQRASLKAFCTKLLKYSADLHTCCADCKRIYAEGQKSIGAVDPESIFTCNHDLSLQKIQRIHRHAVLQKLKEHICALHRVIFCRLCDVT